MAYLAAMLLNEDGLGILFVSEYLNFVGISSQMPALSHCTQSQFSSDKKLSRCLFIEKNRPSTTFCLH